MARTRIGDGIYLVEEDGLCVITPDPYEQMVDAYLAQQEAEHDAFLECVDLKVGMLSTPCHDDEAPTFHHGSVTLPCDHYYDAMVSYGILRLRVRKRRLSEHVDWVDLYSMGAGIDDAAISARM